jgi:hypothetical protein
VAHFLNSPAVVDHAKRTVPRCLIKDELQRFCLETVPCRCITGPGHKADNDPTIRQPK